MSSSRITAVEAWEALDSRGTPTVACEVRLAGGARGCATVPSGASVGTHEAVELRDGGERYGGRGVLRAVENVRTELGPALIGEDASEGAALDDRLCELDATPNLSRLGANAVLAVSIAVALAAAEAEGLPLHRALDRESETVLLPLPMINIVSGGAHAGGAIDIQDVLAVPVGARTFAEAIEWTWRVRRGTVERATALGLPTALVADEGGLGLPLASNRLALELVEAGIEAAGLRPGDDVALAIDVAATQLASGDDYRLAAESRTVSADELIDELQGWCSKHPIVSLEDLLAEDAWTDWRQATRRLGAVQLLGDDLFVTSTERVQRGIDERVANAVLVKPNQAGTLSRARAALALAQQNGYATVVSARSGESEDAWLADLAVGWRAGQIKVGSLTRSERMAKWNRLLRIEREAGPRAVFAGRGALAPLP